MDTVSTIAAVRAQIRAWRRAGETIAFVPTMGNLHDGHVALVEAARQRATRVLVSIFVNPMQFGANEDFGRYPRTLTADQARLTAAGADVLFAPAVEEIYPRGHGAVTRVEVPEVSEGLCGAARPGHFTGVATVVAKLFNIVQPDCALFGEKDYQQLQVIRRMVADLSFPIDIIGMPTVREADGLAMSSRNGYLRPEQRQQAAGLYRTLRGLAERLRAGERDYPRLEQWGMQSLETLGFRPDYVAIRRPDLGAPDMASPQLVILAAAWLGQTRLIDNLAVSLRS